MPPGWGSTLWPPRLVSLLQHQHISLDKKCHDIHMEEFLKHCMVHHPGSCKLHTTLLAKHTPGSIPVPASRIQVHDQRSRNGNKFNPLLNSIYHALEKSQYTTFFFISILVPTYLVLKIKQLKDNDFVDLIGPLCSLWVIVLLLVMMLFFVP